MKHKNNDMVPKIFLAVVGVILTGIIVYYVMNSVNSTTKLADSVISNTEEITIGYEEQDIVMYDGEDIRGSEVVNFIKKHLGDYSASETAPIYVKVVTKSIGGTNINEYTNNTHMEDINNFSNLQYYIKPTAIFTGDVIRTENMVIEGVEFTQK